MSFRDRLKKIFAAEDSLTFDFNQAVADARRDYPEETKNTTFINTSSPQGKELLMQWCRDAMNAAGWTEENWKDPVFQAQYEQVVKGLLRKAHMGASTRTVTNMKLLVMAAENDAVFYPPPLNNPFFRFNHELGHIVTEAFPEAGKSRTTSDDKKLNLEEIADVYGVLRCLQKGSFSKEELNSLIQARTKSYDQPHNTSAVLAKLYKAWENFDPAALTPKKIKAEARKYSRH